MKLSFITFFIGSITAVGTNAYGASLKTEMDGYVLDWAASRLQVTAAASPEKTEESYQAAEKSAWANGIAMIRDVSKKVYTDHYLSVGATSEVLEEPSNNAGLRAARAVFSKDTEYVSDGSVNVALEARLSNVLAPFGVKHMAETKPDYKNLLKTTTGVVFKIDCPLEPRADLEIVSPSGETIYAPYLISKVAYGEVLVGRWYQKPAKWEIRRAAGKASVEVPVACNKDGRLVADMPAWEAIDASERQVIVEAARVALVVNK